MKQSILRNIQSIKLGIKQQNPCTFEHSKNKLQFMHVECIIEIGTIAFARSLAPAASRCRAAPSTRIRLRSDELLAVFQHTLCAHRGTFHVPAPRILLRTSPYIIVLFRLRKGGKFHDRIQGAFLP